MAAHEFISPLAGRMPETCSFLITGPPTVLLQALTRKTPFLSVCVHYFYAYVTLVTGPSRPLFYLLQSKTETKSKRIHRSPPTPGGNTHTHTHTVRPGFFGRRCSRKRSCTPSVRRHRLQASAAWSESLLPLSLTEKGNELAGDPVVVDPSYFSSTLLNPLPPLVAHTSYPRYEFFRIPSSGVPPEMLSTNARISSLVGVGCVISMYLHMNSSSSSSNIESTVLLGKTFFPSQSATFQGKTPFPISTS